MKRILFVFCLFVMFSQLLFSQEKGLVGANKVNIRNAPSMENSKVLYQLNAGDQVTVYSTIGDKSVSNNVVNFWYKISKDKEIWINAEYVYTFPCDYVELTAVGPGEYRYSRCVIQDYKMETDKLYFLIKYVNTPYTSFAGEPIIRWEKASDYEWIEKKSKNAGFFIKYFDDLYTEEYLNANPNLFTKEKPGRWTYYRLIDDSDDIVISDELGGNKFYLYKVILKNRNKTYPYGIKIGMTVDEFLKTMGGYDLINEEKEYLFYERENTLQMTVFYENSCVSRIELYCGL